MSGRPLRFWGLGSRRKREKRREKRSIEPGKQALRSPASSKSGATKFDKSMRDTFVETALRQKGKPYVWGTAGPDTFDCSGLVYFSANAAASRPFDASYRSSHTQWASMGRRVGPQEILQPGDLLFYDTANDGAGHVGIYIRPGEMIHALNKDSGVVVSNPFSDYFKPLYLGARRLWDGGGTTPIGTPTAKPTAVGRTIGPMTPVRSIGDCSIEKWRETLKDSAITDVDACYDACRGHTALALVMAIKESSLGKAPGSAEAKNPLGLLLPDGKSLQRFQYWPLAFAEWRKRLTDPSYKGLPGPYFPKGVAGIVPGWDLSLLGHHIIYVGGPRCLSSQGAECANGETYDPTYPKDGPTADDARAPSINRYVAQSLVRLRALLGISTTPVPDPTPHPGDGWQRVRFAGTNVDCFLPDDILVSTILTRVGPNRPGDIIRVTGTAQHETGNERHTAGAIMHSNWQDSGTPGHPDGYVGVHFYVDDDRIIQKIPLNESSIHAGDWGRNHSQLSIERCVNRDQTPFEQSERNSAYLQAALLKYVLRTTAKESMYSHRTPGAGCPVYIGRHWTQFEDRVDRIIREELP